jgi:hypothetical protein
VIPDSSMICFASSGMDRSVIFNGCWRLWLKGISMGAEKFFCRESEGFLFASCGLLLVLYIVSGSVYFHFVVRFCIVCGAIQHTLWCGLPCSRARDFVIRFCRVWFVTLSAQH